MHIVEEISLGLEGSGIEGLDRTLLSVHTHPVNVHRGPELSPYPFESQVSNSLFTTRLS